MATKSNISTIDTIPQDQVAEDQAPEVSVVSGANHDDAVSGGREIVTIHSSPDDNGSDAVFVSLNGYSYQIPRDKPCEVPTEVVDILRNSVVSSYVPGEGGAMAERLRPRYAFSSQKVA